MGAGIIGTTSAYFLACLGHQVTVLEKESTCGLGATYGSGAQLSYSHIDPWRFWPMLLATIKPNSFVSINSAELTNKKFLSWLVEFIKNSRSTTDISTKLASLTNHSRLAMLEIIASEKKLKPLYKKTGSLHFFRKEKELETAKKIAEFQKTLGISSELFDNKQVLHHEPLLLKLFDDEKLAGGIFYPEDAVLDGLAFTQELEKICVNNYGVEFVYQASVRNIFTNQKKITGIHTDRGVFTGDEYVYALGSYGTKLLNGIKINPQIYPVKGYSLSVPLTATSVLPKATMIDAKNRMVYSYLDSAFRIAGTAEIAGLKADLKSKNVHFMTSAVKKSFAECGDLSRARTWCGFRPFRPNSLPLICRVNKYGNLLINSGHGSLGITLAAGSAKILASLVTDNKSEFAFLGAQEARIY